MRKNKMLSGGFLYKFREKNFNFFCVILALGIFLIFIRALSAGLTPGRHSFFELYLWSMGDAVNIVFIHTIIFLFIVSKIFLYGPNDMIAILHQNSKKSIWIANIYSVLITSILYVVGTCMALLLTSINKNIFNVGETEFIRKRFSGLFHTADSHTGWIIMGITGNVLAYFICIALLYYIFLNLFQQKLTAFICTLVCIFLEYIVYLRKIYYLERYTMLGNLLLCYGRGKEDVKLHFFYWFPILTFLCILSCWLTTKNDIIYQKKRGIISSIFHTFTGILPNWKRKNLFFTIILGLLYFHLTYNYSENRSSMLLSNFYSGSDKIDVKFLLWLFFELAVTLYVTNRIFQFLNYNTSVRILHFKSRKKYADYLTYTVSIETLCFFLIFSSAVSISLWAQNGSLYTNHFQHESGFLIIINTFVSFIIFSYFVCLIYMNIKNFALSYLIIFVLQQFHMALYRLIGDLCCFLPLLHGCSGLYKDHFNLYAALAYQITEVIILQTIFRQQVTKCIVDT